MEGGRLRSRSFSPSATRRQPGRRQRHRGLCSVFHDGDVPKAFRRLEGELDPVNCRLAQFQCRNGLASHALPVRGSRRHVDAKPTATSDGNPNLKAVMVEHHGEIRREDCSAFNVTLSLQPSVGTPVESTISPASLIRKCLPVPASQAGLTGQMSQFAVPRPARSRARRIDSWKGA